MTFTAPDDRCAYLDPSGQEASSTRHSWTAWQDDPDGRYQERSCRRCGRIEGQHHPPKEDRTITYPQRFYGPPDCECAAWSIAAEWDGMHGENIRRVCSVCGVQQSICLGPTEGFVRRGEEARERNRLEWDPPQEVRAAICRDMAELLANLDPVLDYARTVKKQREQADKQNSVLGLFGAEAAALPEPAWVEAEPLTWDEVCRREKEAFGFYWHRSPQIARLEQALRDYEKAGSRRGRLVSIAEIKRRFTGREQP